jgi:hypothetical protein
MMAQKGRTRMAATTRAETILGNLTNAVVGNLVIRFGHVL